MAKQQNTHRSALLSILDGTTAKGKRRFSDLLLGRVSPFAQLTDSEKEQIRPKIMRRVFDGQLEFLNRHSRHRMLNGYFHSLQTHRPPRIPLNPRSWDDLHSLSPAEQRRFEEDLMRRWNCEDVDFADVHNAWDLEQPRPEAAALNKIMRGKRGRHGLGRKKGLAERFIAKLEGKLKKKGRRLTSKVRGEAVFWAERLCEYVVELMESAPPNPNPDTISELDADPVVFTAIGKLAVLDWTAPRRLIREMAGNYGKNPVGKLDQDRWILETRADFQRQKREGRLPEDVKKQPWETLVDQIPNEFRPKRRSGTVTEQRVQERNRVHTRYKRLIKQSRPDAKK